MTNGASKLPLSRRRFLAGATATETLTLAAPHIPRAQGEPLKIGVYGGYMSEAFDAEIFPKFSEAMAIEVQSVAVPRARLVSCSRRRAPRGRQPTSL